MSLNCKSTNFIVAHHDYNTASEAAPMVLRYKRASSTIKLYLYTVISRKVVWKNVHATILKGNMRYDQYTVAVELTFVAFL